VSTTPTSTTGSSATKRRDSGSRSTSHASSGTRAICAFTSTVDSPAPTSKMACVHKSASPANSTPAATAVHLRPGGSPPARERSRAASTATTGSASRQRYIEAVAGEAPARPITTAEAETVSAPTAIPVVARRTVGRPANG
jgi:hypothetical protein